MIDLTRRALVTGLISFAAAAPAIIRPGMLMPVKAQPLWLFTLQGSEDDGLNWRDLKRYYGELDGYKFIDIGSELRTLMLSRERWGAPICRFMFSPEAREMMANVGGPRVASALPGGKVRAVSVPVVAA